MISNKNDFSQNSRITYRNQNSNDSDKIVRFLRQQANQNELGNLGINDRNLIKSCSKIMCLDSNTFIINSTPMVNMECIKYIIPFDQELRKESYYSFETPYFEMFGYTENSFCLINGEQVVYIGFNLNYLDNSDYDGDGCDEIVFYFKRYNYDGYIMVSDELTNYFEYGWYYH